MATGILSRTNISSTANTSVYTTPAGKVSSFTLSLTNRNATQDAQVKVAISDTTTPALGDFIEFNTSIPPFGTLERTGIVANAASILVVSSSTANLSAVVYGIEE